MPDGAIWETWFSKTKLSDRNHLMVNGYANSWLIDTAKICDKDGFCVKNNDDNSYDFELVIEFLPQKYFYLGFAVSGLVLLVSLIYIISFKNNNEKKPVPS